MDGVKEEEKEWRSDQITNKNAPEALSSLKKMLVGNQIGLRKKIVDVLQTYEMRGDNG